MHESDVLAELLAESEPFRRYYESIRPGIELGIQWVEGGLPEGVTGGSRFTRGRPEIALNRLPARVEDVEAVAHELTHLTLDYEGYPTAYCPDHSPHGRVSIGVNNLLTDPIVHERLLAAGIEVLPAIAANERRSRQQLASTPAPKDEAGHLHWAMMYAEMRLESQVARPGTDESAFGDWFRREYPDVAATGDSILDLIASEDLRSPGGVSKAMLAVLKAHALHPAILPMTHMHKRLL